MSGCLSRHLSRYVVLFLREVIVVLMGGCSVSMFSKRIRLCQIMATFTLHRLCSRLPMLLYTHPRITHICIEQLVFMYHITRVFSQLSRYMNGVHLRQWTRPRAMLKSKSVARALSLSSKAVASILDLVSRHQVAFVCNSRERKVLNWLTITPYRRAQLETRLWKSNSHAC